MISAVASFVFVLVLLVFVRYIYKKKRTMETEIGNKRTIFGFTHPWIPSIFLVVLLEFYVNFYFFTMCSQFLHFSSCTCWWSCWWQCFSNWQLNYERRGRVDYSSVSRGKKTRFLRTTFFNTIFRNRWRHSEKFDDVFAFFASFSRTW